MNNKQRKILESQMSELKIKRGAHQLTAIGCTVLMIFTLFNIIIPIVCFVILMVTNSQINSIENEIKNIKYKLEEK